MRGTIAIATIVGVVAVAGSSARTVPIREASTAYPVRAAKLTSLIAEATVATWNCQRKLVLLGVRERVQPMSSPWALPRSVAYRKWVLGVRLKRQATCLKTLNHIARFVIPDTLDWQSAITYAQKPYPGTYDWLWSCSGAEGGHGSWVWYGNRPWRGYHIGNDFLGMNTVGGWMQFRFYGTFDHYWPQAVADLKRRGFILPVLKMPPAGGDPKFAPWLSPVGQALTAGYMRYYGKDDSHWSASWGRGC